MTWDGNKPIKLRDTGKYIDVQYKPKVDPAFNHFGPIEIRVATDYPIGTSFGRINFGVILLAYIFTLITHK